MSNIRSQIGRVARSIAPVQIRAMSTTEVGSAVPQVSSVRYADFRSDTVTKPTAQMTIAMIDAQVGDDVYGEDPTVNQLETYGAKLLEKEAAVYVPTSTMANLISMGAWLSRGQSAVLGDESHIFVYEQGGMSWLMGGVMHTLPNAPNGTFALTGKKSLQEAFEQRPDDSHYSSIGCVAIENTHNRCGGAVLPVKWIDELSVLCKEQEGGHHGSGNVDRGSRQGVPIHMDGARLMNAAAATGQSAARIARGVDSISLCLSKGLGAPAGSLVIGSKDFVARARRLRKAVGGGMRQVGVIAASGMIGLKEHVSKLPTDHARAKSLARGLAAVHGVLLKAETIQTNIVFFDLDLTKLHSDNLRAKVQAAGGKLVVEGTAEQGAVDVAEVFSTVAGKPGSKGGPTTAAVFGALLHSLGRIRVGSYGTDRLRAVTHHQVGDADVDRFITTAAATAQLLSKQ